MARIEFNIRCSYEGKPEVKRITGYTFQWKDLYFGVSNDNPIDREDKFKEWTITELNTGYRILSAGKKDEAINEILEMDLDIIRKGIEKAGVSDINEDTIIQSEYLSAE